MTITHDTSTEAQDTVWERRVFSREKHQAILSARANAMARHKEQVGYSGNKVELLKFSLNQEKYGIELCYIQEVYPLKELTMLPGLPPFVLGVVNIRGQILSIIDMRVFFELSHEGFSDLNRIIILHSSEMKFGVLADTIQGVCQVPEKEILTSMPTLTGIRAKYLRGISKDHRVILDGGKLLSDPKIVVDT